MSANLQPFIEGVTKRLGEFAQASPFKGNPFGGVASAFQNPFGGAQSPFQNTQLAVGNPFSNPLNPTASPFTNQLATRSPFAGGMFDVGSPFNGGAFGVSSPFGNSFGNVSSPFGGNPFNVGNPAAMESAARAEQQRNSGSGSGNGTNSGGMDFSGPATADDNEGITAEQVDAFIRSKFPNSPLAGQGATLLAEANRNGVSVLMMLGIAWKESGLGSNVGKGNIWGITDPSTDGGIGGVRTFQHWGSLQEEIAAAARLLGSSTYRGKSAADQISTWYVGRPYAGSAGADDAAGNGTVDNYLDNFIAPTYAAFGRGFGKTVAPTARPGGGIARGGGTGDVSSLGPDAARKAQSVMGVGYTHGGIRNTGNPMDGMDCSSFSGWLLGLDRKLWNAQIQYDNTQRVGANEAQAGDLVFFQGTTDNDPSARPVTHVGVYLGNGMMVHTGGDGGVMVVNLNTPYWQKFLYGYGRVRR